MALIQGKQIADLAITTGKLADNALDATAGGRAKMADAFFDSATFTAKTAAGAVALDRLAEAVLQADGGQAMTGSLSAGGFLLTNLGAPSADNDAARKVYVDTVAQGLDVKDSVRLATAAALPANTAAGSGVGKTLTMNAVGVLTIDGVAVLLNNRVLVKDEAAGANNGIYKCTTEGTAIVAAVLTRAVDADQNAEVTAGLFAFASEGTANADSGWVLTTNDPITVDTTALAFAQFSGAGQVTAGVGLTKTGNTIDVGAASVGLVLNADSLEVAYGLVAGITTVNAGDVASAGVASTAARGDHEHAVSTGAPDEAAQLGAAAAEGDATSLSRSDHVHKANTAGSALAAAGTIGTSQDIARADHQHARDVERQEAVTTQAITGTDTAMTDTLDNAPTGVLAVQLYLNGIFQQQGAGFDYTLGGAGNQTITWLAATGTAVDMTVADSLVAKYVS